MEKRGVEIGSAFNYTLENVFDPVLPLQAGHILHTCPVAEAQEDMRFIFEVAINESEVAKGQPLSLLVRFISMEVRRVIDQLYPLL